MITHDRINSKITAVDIADNDAFLLGLVMGTTFLQVQEEYTKIWAWRAYLNQVPYLRMEKSS